MDTHIATTLSVPELAKSMREKLLTIIAGLSGTPAAQINIDDHFECHLGFDFLDRLNLACLVEQQLGVRVPDKTLVELELVGSFIAHVLAEVARRPAAAALRPPVDLARVGLDAGCCQENGLVMIEVFPLGSGRRFLLTIAGDGDDDAAKLADNIARRLSRDSDLLPIRTAS